MNMTQAAAALGRKGGKAKSAAKRAASRDNGKQGGRPVAPGRLFNSWPAAFDECRRLDKPLLVAVPVPGNASRIEVARIWPSGRALHLRYCSAGVNTQ